MNNSMIGKKFGRPKIDLLNIRFGKLIVIESVIGGWICQCDCGNKTKVTGGHLREGRVVSCGCHKKSIAKNAKKHGKYYTKAYPSWVMMVQRCNNPNNKRYSTYGARGITVCEYWLTFENFLSDMGQPPVGYTLDRIDNDKGYFKENCRWATVKTQNRNTRANRKIEIDGVIHCLATWCEIKKINYTTAHSRLHRGWSPKKALGIE